ncbi:carbohydrate ABC transporter permease [Paenibacillus chondroitinus]|uniref:Carbohydrate ABC transporter permease n=1 Tax=Paenibacillus chondroitinus TaxID=59842 RepID=A0ABU6D7R2_9BACL|nr:MULTISPECIES: carbohydrate ABC transporter permease [Paenibacillus]MCY9661693.1 carbohydrate ABC transporter permease [Paenibacillus anseongense]MEB4793778.1 carbohydrate ABC transporter permease [Paenibacillus chondroitinus]
MAAKGTDRLFVWIVYALLALASLLVIVPFIYVVVVSFATKHEVLARGFFLYPKEWTLNSYQFLLREQNFITSFKNSLVITIIGTAINISMTSLMAYGLSKVWLPGRKTINFLVLVTMLFSGGIIPTYLVIKAFGLLDSYSSLWLSGAIAPFHLIVMRSFFQNFPAELEESSRMDGCGELRLFWQIVLPLSMPAVATFTLFYMVQNWNTYFSALLYLNDTQMWPLQVYLRQMLIESSDSSMMLVVEGFEYGPPVKMAAVVIVAAPMLLVYPFMQKHFNQGMLLGSVKG